jgi:deoxyadenosine/deoxycytidine kinase
VSRPPYIAIAGNIGAGKSSFLRFLTTRYDIDAVYEPNEDNPFLERFYADMSRWAFHSQIWFLGRKLQLQNQFESSERAIVQDRTIWEDAEIFARQLALSGAMSRDDWDAYETLYRAAISELRQPDLLVYLRCPVRTLRKRIRARGRDMEQDIPSKYLKALHQLYEAWYASWDLCPSVVFETNRFDPVTDIVDLHRAVEIIDAHVSW